MLSWGRNCARKEETLLLLNAALCDQLNRVKVEALALQSMSDSRRGDERLSSPAVPEQSYVIEAESPGTEEEEEEEEEESDSLRRGKARPLLSKEETKSQSLQPKF
ncbi:hypothetical protein P7K49_007388 [Saguinus oedipus]|uniref:Uncharacterized protein n=1 Tax=Saguinus oedipus TaxID=9490 RepID=A0ABQ9VYA6_SAGOE|nr:hypothetical protein P7K49_007388 [Saguinus oedipus]